jgi:small conductance mechanosensitive channel
MISFLAVFRWAIFAEGHFLGKILDEWIVDTQEFIRLKLPHLVVVLVIAFILYRILSLITFHMTRVAERHAANPDRIHQVKTVAGVLRATGIAVITFITGLQILEIVGLNLAPLLASAGVAGVAIGLAAQNIVRDMLNGVMILIEDQFNVGDTIKIAGLAGTVEAMTLRKTTIRDGDGTLYIIPNSQITTVANQSVGYSVATVNVSVDFSADPDKVSALLKSIAMDIRNSAEFRPVFLEDPKVLGVDALHGSEVVIPVIFKTLATQQYGPIREFRRRVRLALEENNLLPGDPNRVFNKYMNRIADKSDSTTEVGHNVQPSASGQPAPPPAPPNPENPLESTQPPPQDSTFPQNKSKRT